MMQITTVDNGVMQRRWKVFAKRQSWKMLVPGQRTNHKHMAYSAGLVALVWPVAMVMAGFFKGVYIASFRF